MGKNGSVKASNFIIHALISILIGVLLIAYPNVALDFMVYIIGVFSILIGIITLFSLKNQVNVTSGRRYMLIMNGIIGILLGLVFIAFPNIFRNILFILIGVIIMVVASMQFYMLWQRKMIDSKASATIFILPAVIFITGALIVYDPFTTAEITVRAIGIAVLLYGIFELILRWKFRQSLNNSSYIER